MSDPVGAPCSVIFQKKTGEQHHCEGKVFSVETMHILEDEPRMYGFAVCDTCQAKYESWCDLDGDNPTILVTAGRARGVPPGETTFHFQEFDEEGET